MRRSNPTRHILFASLLASCLGGCAALHHGSSVAAAEPLQPAPAGPVIRML